MVKVLKKNITLLNTISSLILQFLTIISGFIIPKLILSYFGSEVNGLVSSLGQFLNFIGLLEGGITGVVMASLYRPLYNKDYEKISSIIKTANKFYWKISIIFLIYSLGVAIIYPIFSNTSFSYGYVFSLTMIMAIGVFIQYCFSISLKTLLNADKKVYIVCLSQSVILVINIILTIISIKIFPSVHLLKIIASISYILQPLIYNYYVKKLYKIDKKAKEDVKLLKSRWDGFSVNIATFIHFSTDIVVLTLFTDLNTVSIYSVYVLVTNGLRNVVSSISSAVMPTIGQLYVKDNKEELEEKFYLCEHIMFIIIFLLFAVASLLITPFVVMYTKNVSDANYYQPVFGILLVLSEALYLIKSHHLNLAFSANKFKELAPSAYIEVIINMLLSLILVRRFKLIGVIIGTIVAMIYRLIYSIYYTDKVLIRGAQKKFYKRLFIFLVFTSIGLIFSVLVIPSVKYNFANWIWHGILYSLIFALLYIILTWIFYRNDIKKLLSLKNKIMD